MASDEALASDLQRALTQEPVFSECRVRVGGEPGDADPGAPDPEVNIAAENGVLWLSGTVRSGILAGERSDGAVADEASRESFPASDPPAATPVTGTGQARH